MNIYANRVVKSSARKDTESVTKQKGEASFWGFSFPDGAFLD